jgi:hypothetical protein
MRRGLIAWSQSELPPSVFDMRVAHAQAALAAEGLDALAIYTNHTRPAGVSWFTGFIPYWSEGLLVLPATGRTTLAVALSKRGQPWINEVSYIGALISGPRIGTEAGGVIAASKPGAAVGVLELDNLPTGTAAQLRAVDPAMRLVDATPLFERLRATAEPAEIALATHAAQIARDALAAIEPDVRDAAAAVAAVDGAARLAAAEEVYVAVAADLGRSARFVRSEGPGAPLGAAFALRATVAYKGQWVRMVRAIVRDPARAGAPAAARERLTAAVARLPDPNAFAGIGTWLVEATTRSQPLEPLGGSMLAAGRRSPAGKIVTVSAVIPVDGLPIPVGAPAFGGTRDRAAAFLVQPDFA